MAIINLWYATFGQTAKCLLLSQGQTEAYDLLSKVGFTHSHLPDYLKLTVNKDNREMFTMKNGLAEIRALPSTEKAGHGFQGTIVTRDELARHEEARKNFRAVARSGAKLVELSTANKEDPTNYFGEKTEEFFRHPQTVKKVYPSGIELYTNPAKPKVCLVFLSWELRPTREEGLTLDEWWNAKILPRYTKAEIEEQFPSTIDDVFKASAELGYFNSARLEDMGYDVRPPIRQTEIDTHNNIIRVYTPPLAGRKYVLFTDPSSGGDPFVTGVMDYITGEVVCSATGHEVVDKVAEIHHYLVGKYNDATNSFEYTGSVGGEMWRILHDLKTPNQAPRRKPDGKIDLDKKGQWVSNEHRVANFGYLASQIDRSKVICHDREFIQQAKMVKRGKTVDQKEKIDTDRKQSFDWVMMMVGLFQLHKYAPVGSMQVTSSKYA